MGTVIIAHMGFLGWNKITFNKAEHSRCLIAFTFFPKVIINQSVPQLIKSRTLRHHCVQPHVRCWCVGSGTTQWAICLRVRQVKLGSQPWHWLAYGLSWLWPFACATLRAMPPLLKCHPKRPHKTTSSIKSTSCPHAILYSFFCFIFILAFILKWTYNLQ